jgi:hypothetical protein
VKRPRISVRNGFITVGVGILLLLTGMFIAIRDVGTREMPFQGAIGVAAILTALVILTWGVVQILASWGDR